MKKQHLHEWEWNNPPIALDCKKCGEYLDCGNIVEHINALESQLAEAKARLAGYEWIPVSERLPEDEEEVLLFSMSSGYFIAIFHDASSGRGIDTFETDGDDMAPVFHPDSSVLYWMPLPKAPKEEE